MKKNTYQSLGLFLTMLALALNGCAGQASPESQQANGTLNPTSMRSVVPTNTIQHALPATVTPTLEPTRSSRIIIHPSDTPTIEPTHVSQPETIIFSRSDKSNPANLTFPNLWTRIDKADITIYPYDYISDFIYDKDGSLWIVGGFGVLHRMPNGEQTIYTINNGLTRQFFTRVAISPKGEIWVGGTDNALFRFDGSRWIDEGEKLPSPNDYRDGWTCYSQDISGIDFDQDGSAWVMNNGIEIYTQAYGQWVNFPFPKEILPNAGGGGCPIGIRVIAEDDITIMISGCCMGSPHGYHFGGEVWEEGTDYAVVEELLFNRRHATLDEVFDFFISVAHNKTAFADYLLFSKDNSLFWDLSPSQYNNYSITSNREGGIWITDGSQLYTNSSGKFLIMAEIFESGWGVWPENSSLTQSEFIVFDKDVFNYQKEKNPGDLIRMLRENVLSWYDNFNTALGNNNQVWIYSPQDDGLILVDQGKIKKEKLPDTLNGSQAGGVYVFKDGRILVGSTGEIWEYQNGDWRQYTILNSQVLFTHFVEDDNGAIYAATDTGVYRLDNETYSVTKFMEQNSRTLVESEETDCSFHKHYSTCFAWSGGYSPEDVYKAVTLGIQPDGSIIYVNNRLVSQLKDGKWKSFFYNTFEIDSAAIDKDGYIWLFSNTDGLFRLAPDVFDAYQETLD